jgi:hypothetical protein
VRIFVIITWTSVFQLILLTDCYSISLLPVFLWMYFWPASTVQQNTSHISVSQLCCFLGFLYFWDGSFNRLLQALKFLGEMSSKYSEVMKCLQLQIELLISLLLSQFAWAWIFSFFGIYSAYVKQMAQKSSSKNPLLSMSKYDVKFIARYGFLLYDLLDAGDNYYILFLSIFLQLKSFFLNYIRDIILICNIYYCTCLCNSWY